MLHKVISKNLNFLHQFVNFDKNNFKKKHLNNSISQKYILGEYMNNKPYKEKPNC